MFAGVRLQARPACKSPTGLPPPCAYEALPHMNWKTEEQRQEAYSMLAQPS